MQSRKDFFGPPVAVVRPDLDRSASTTPTGWSLSCKAALGPMPGLHFGAVLNIEMTNRGASPRNTSLGGHSFEVWLVHNGHEVPLTPKGRLEFPRVRYPDKAMFDETASRDLEFPADGTLSQKIELTDLFSLSEPGTYLAFVTWISDTERVNAVAATSFEWPN